MENCTLVYIIKNIPILKSRIELFPQQLALLEESFFDSIKDLYRNQIQEFYELMKEQKALRGSSIKSDINVTLSSFYDIDSNSVTFEYLRKLQSNMVPFLIQYLIDSVKKKNVKVFEILYGIKLMKISRQVFEGFLDLSDVSIVHKDSNANHLLRNFLDTLVLEYETIIYFTKMIDHIIDIVVEWTDIDKMLTSLSETCNNASSKKNEKNYIEKRQRQKLLDKVNKKVAMYDTQLRKFISNIDGLYNFVTHPDIQVILIMEIVQIYRSYLKSLPKSILVMFSSIHKCLEYQMKQIDLNGFLIEYFLDYLFRKYIVLFSQTLENLTCFYIHRYVKKSDDL